jgi:ribosome-associated protein
VRSARCAPLSGSLP